MVSSVSSHLRLELMADGEANNTWGLSTNTNLQILERAISGYTDVPITGTTTTLTSTNFAVDTWLNMGLRVTGTLTAATSLVVPTFDKLYVLENATTGAFSLTVKTAAGTGVIVPQGERALLLCDGTNVVGTILQSYSVELAALSALATTGITVRTGTGTVTTRTLTAPAAGITITNGSGVSGNPTLALANDLAALEGLASTGIAVRTAADTWAQRTLTAPAAGITVTNGNGVSGNPTLALANDLAALEGLSTTGLIVRTADGTATTRAVTAPAAGITVTNGDGVAGAPTLALANDLGALEALASTGIAVRSATDTWAQRTLTGTTNQITVTNGNGVSGNPTLSLPSAITVPGSLTTTTTLAVGTTATIGTGLTVSAGGAAITGNSSIAGVLTGTSSSFDPPTNVAAAFTATGPYGGGILAKDSTGYVGMWARDTGATLVFGLGTTSLTERMTLTSSGLTVANGLTVSAGGATITGATTIGGALTLTSINRLIMGTDPGTIGASTLNPPRMAIAGTSGAANCNIALSNTSSSAGVAGELWYVKSLAAGGTPTTTNNSLLGANRFYGHDSSVYGESAVISAAADAAHAAGSTPGRLVFSTTASGAVASTERMRIDSAGVVQIGFTSSSLTARLNLVHDSSTGLVQALMLRDTNTSAAADTGPTIDFQFNDGTSNRGVGFIKTLKENGTSGNWASYMAFFTRTNGVGNPAERMRISSTGAVGIGGASGGDRLQVTTAADSTADGLLMKSPSVGWVRLYPSTAAGAYNPLAQTNQANLLFSAGAVNTGSLLIGAWSDVAAGTTFRADGKVGIGISAPTALFQAGDATNKAGLEPRSDGAALGGIPSANLARVGGWYATNPIPGSAIHFAAQGGAGQRGAIALLTKDADDDTTQPTVRVVVTQGGNVGVGTTSPVVPLDVASASDTKIRVQTNDGVDTRLTAWGGVAMVGQAGTWSNHPFLLYSNATERMRIDTAGNVLVGQTADVGGKLQINGTSATALGIVHSAANANAASLAFYKSRHATVGSHTAVVSNDSTGAIYFHGSDGANWKQNAGIVATTEGTIATNQVPGNLYLQTANATGTLTSRVYVGSSGYNVFYPGTNAEICRFGDGTVDPNAKTDQYITVFGKTTGTPVNLAVGFGVLNTEGWVGSTTNHPFSFRTNNTTRAYFDNSNLVSRVWISVDALAGYNTVLTDSSLYFMNTEGRYYANGGGGHYFHAAGVWKATINADGTYSVVSDQRLKDNIQDLAPTLATVLQLRPVTYELKDTGQPMTGLIAQEVLPLVPEVVAHNEQEDLYSLNYAGLIPHLIQALKEQNDLIQALEARIDALEAA